MLDEAAPLPEDPADLKALACLLIAEVKAQAALIAKLRHQIAGARTHRYGSSSESADQLHLARRVERGGHGRDHGPAAAP